MRTRTVRLLIKSWRRANKAAENNPANDYPDEELSWDDEEDDPTAIYSKYRDRAASDDEEFGFDGSTSDGDRYEFVDELEMD